MTAAVQERIESCGAALAELQAELDWELLGREYCEGDGGGFFDAQRRSEVLDTALVIADELGRRLSPGGRSLYLGAALAELPTMVCEELVLGREVRWLNLDSPELRELDRALRVVESRLGLPRLAPSTAGLSSVAAESCDHLWMVSVLTDPERFPALHDELYERRGTELATGRGALEVERRSALALAREFLACGAAPCALSTTEEELGLLEPLARELGRALGPAQVERTTAIVGDRWSLRALARAR